jgi:hypothetical protein
MMSAAPPTSKGWPRGVPNDASIVIDPDDEEAADPASSWTVG